MEKLDKNNNNEIKITWYEHIRSRPGFFLGRRIGDSDSRNDVVHELLKAVMNNAVDQSEQGHGQNIDVTIKDNVVNVRDYGCGMPFDKLMCRVTNLNPNEGCWALMLTNALSSHFKIQSFRDGKTKTIEFFCGELIGESSVEVSDQRSGTSISFTLDDSLLGKYQWLSQRIANTLRNYACLNKGFAFNYNGQKILSKNGLYDLLCHKTKLEEMLYAPIHLQDEKFEFVFTHTTRNCGEEFYSFVNKHYTPRGGTHQNAFRNALATTIRTYFGKWYETDDICNAVSAVISIKVQEPLYETGAQTRLGSEMMQPEGQTIHDYVNDVVGRLLGDYLHKHTDIGDIILNRINKLEEMRKELP